MYEQTVGVTRLQISYLMTRVHLYKVPYGEEGAPQAITGAKAREILEEVGLVAGQDEAIDFVIEFLERDGTIAVLVSVDPQLAIPIAGLGEREPPTSYLYIPYPDDVRGARPEKLATTSSLMVDVSRTYDDGPCFEYHGEADAPDVGCYCVGQCVPHGPDCCPEIYQCEWCPGIGKILKILKELIGIEEPFLDPRPLVELMPEEWL